MESKEIIYTAIYLILVFGFYFVVNEMRKSLNKRIDLFPYKFIKLPPKCACCAYSVYLIITDPFLNKKVSDVVYKSKYNVTIMDFMPEYIDDIDKVLIIGEDRFPICIRNIKFK